MPHRFLPWLGRGDLSTGAGLPGAMPGTAASVAAAGRASAPRGRRVVSLVSSVLLVLATGVMTLAVGPATAHAATSGTAYVVNNSSNTVSVIDAATNRVTKTIPTGAGPTSITVQPSGDQAYVSNLNGGTVTVLKLTAAG